MTETANAARLALRTQLAAGSTATLTASLATLCAGTPLDEAGRMVQSMIVDELTDRMPALLDALDAWIEDDDTPFDTSADVVLNALINGYVVTFARGPIVGAGALNGLRRMSLADARALLATAANIPKAGRIVHALTLDAVESSGPSA